MSRVDAKTNPLTKGLTQNLFKIPFTRDKSIKFDGTDDVITTSADSTLATKTYSFWAKSEKTTAGGVFDHGASNHGAFYFNFSNGRPLLYLANGWFRYWEDVSSQDDGTWHHYLVLLHTNINNTKLFVDGVEQSVDETNTSSGSALAYTTGIRIGRGGGNRFSGSLDEFAIFDGDQSALADELYNNGQPKNLSSYSTLDHWYRMGEGTLTGGKRDGDENLLFDQSTNGGLGSEKITDGGFDDPSAWLALEGAVVEDGLGKFPTAASNCFIIAGSIVPTTVAAYVLRYDVVSTNGGTLQLAGGNSAFATQSIPSFLGTHSIVLASNGTKTNLQFKGNQSFVGSIDNVSLREVQNVGTINGPAIQADGGTELVVNGDFSNGTTSWTAAANTGTAAISISSGKLRVTSSTPYSYAYQSFPTRVGGVYSFTVDVTKGTSPNYDAYLGTGQNGATLFNSGSTGFSDSQGDTRTITGTFTATSTTTFLNLRSRNQGSITDAFTDFDNVSVKEQTESVPKKVQNLPSAGSAKSMSFDGTDDFVDTGFTPDFIHTNATMSYWVKMGDFSGTQNSGTHNSKRFYLGFNNTAAQFGVQGAVKSSADLSAYLKVGVWHHLAMVAEDGTATFYLDGVARDTLSYTQDIADNPTESLQIGARHHSSNPSNFMNASIDEFAVWDTALDGDAVKALYNAGLPTPVTTKTGAYDIYRDNLKAYYKMGDATNPAQDGTSNLLFDQTNPGVGSEKVTNGTFDGVADGTDPVGNVSGWSAYNSVTTREISGGKLKLVTTSSGSGAKLTITGLTGGRTYKFTCDFVDANGVNIASDFRTLYSAFTGDSPAAPDGKITMFVTIPSGTSIEIFFRCNGADAAGGTAYFDNISFKEINGHTGVITGASIQTEAPKAIYALPPVANTKSINFDGTNDHLVTQVDSAAQPNNESRYYSWWSKSTKTTSNAVWDHGDSNIGAFRFNHNSGRPILYMADSVLRYWVDNSAQDSGEWAHWVVKIVTNSLGDCELWCNGVKQAVSADANSGSMNTYTTGIRIGRAGTGYFSGSIDEMSIHEDLDDESIRALFNRGRPIDISSGNGAYDLSDKALHWWRMGDATSPAADGTNDIIFQGFSETDDELIINGDFSSDSDWTKGTGWSIANGVASCDGSNSSQSTIKTELVIPSGQNNVLYGKTFQLQFDILNYSAGTLAATLEGTGRLEFNGLNSDGSYTAFCTTTSTNPRLNFNASAGFVGSIDNVSVKQVRGQYIGPELVKADDDLYIDARWYVFSDPVKTYPNGTAARFTNPATGGWNKGGRIFLTAGSGTHALTENMETGCAYKLSFDFLTDDSDAVPSYHDGTSATSLPAGSGSKTFYFSYSGNASTRLEAANVSASKFVQFSNLSLTKVGGAAVMTNMTTSDIQTDTPY